MVREHKGRSGSQDLADKERMSEKSKNLKVELISQQMGRRRDILGRSTLAGGFRLKNGKRLSLRGEKVSGHRGHLNLMAVGLDSVRVKTQEALEALYEVGLQFKMSTIILSVGWKIDGTCENRCSVDSLRSCPRNLCKRET